MFRAFSVSEAEGFEKPSQEGSGTVEKWAGALGNDGQECIAIAA